MRLLLLTSLAITVAGCGIGRLVRPDEPLTLGSDTLFALAVRSNEYVTLTFCRDAEYTSCLTTGQLPRDHPVQIYQVPPGQYCLMEILVEPYTGGSGSIHHQIPPERSVCFAAHDGIIAYPGDLSIEVQQREGIWWSVQPQWTWPPDIDERVYAQYPALRGRPIEESRPTWHAPPR